MAKDSSRLNRELIREYREYNEDRDPGRYRFSALIARLSREAGSSNLSRIEEWVSEKEREYGLITSISPETRTENSDLIESLEGHRYIEQVIAETTDPEKKAFFEKLLKSRDRVHK
jgi:hypothetical protein